MHITQESGAGRYAIRGYDRGHIVINEHRYTRSLIVAPDRLILDWPPQNMAELRPDLLELVAALHPDVVLLGTGVRLRFPSREIAGFFRQRGVGMEVMNTAAACRTFNVLMSEGRAVAAALLIS